MPLLNQNPAAVRFCVGCNKLFASQAALANHGITDKECTPEKRFWGRVNKNGHGGCWIFLGALDKWGYGDVGYRGKHVQAHRLAWRLLRGEPGDKDVLHTCNNPPCCNPEHLYLGDDFDNARDRIAAGAFHAKLTPDNVRDIRLELAKYGPCKKLPNGTLQPLADKYGVTDKTICEIYRRKKWKHVA